MGASFAEALHRTRPEIELVGVDADPTTMATALERGIIREPGVEGTDVIVLAVPPLAIRDLLPNLPRQALVTDMASTKARIMVWAAESGVDFVGGHPMCGREASGIGAADPEMFAGAPWVLTRIDSRVEDLVRAVGSYPIVMDPDRHDRLVAAVSHSAFVLSAAYALAVAGSREWPEMAGLASSGFRDMTRLAAGNAEMYAGIAATNGENLVEWLLLIEGQLAKLRRHIEAGDPRLAELFEEAREKRERWLAGQR
ncbi:MAG: prephenate dehydrogenase/arogenate dehydrogenase family protein [Candidatus Dormibacteraeota bacterium]|nr:prephenate dehydrogenase/arogenate dehydrogenase family protein [Candidatus Dormibacteraeota bacterium]